MENNNLNNTPENNNVHFNTEEKISIVESAPANEGSKKLPLIMGISVVLVALIAGIIVFVMQAIEKNEPADSGVVVEASTDEENALDEFYQQILEEKITDVDGNEISREEYITQIQQQIQEATTILTQQVGVTSPHQIIINTTTSPETTVVTNSNSSGNTEATTSQKTENTTAQKTEPVTANKQQTEKAEAQIKAFLNRSCYIEGALYSDNTGDPLSMAFDGDNFEVLTNIDGTEISLMNLDGVMYMKRPALNQYVELTESVLSTLGMDINEFNFGFATTDYDSMKSKLRGVYDATINGNPGVCYEYETTEQIFKFYSEDGNLRQIEIYDLDGKLYSQIAITYFSESIPGNQITLKGCSKTSFGTMFADLL